MIVSEKIRYYDLYLLESLQTVRKEGIPIVIPLILGCIITMKEERQRMDESYLNIRYLQRLLIVLKFLDIRGKKNSSQLGNISNISCKKKRYVSS